MSRQRDYQPTIDRARSQAEIAQRREAKLREKKDDCHREMLRAQAAARIAGEEADALRDRIAAVEQANRDLRARNAQLFNERESVYVIVRAMREDLEAAQHPWRMLWRNARARVADMIRIGAEA